MRAKLDTAIKAYRLDKPEACGNGVFCQIVQLKILDDFFNFM